jgi:hypothetical protein
MMRITATVLISTDSTLQSRLLTSSPTVHKSLFLIFGCALILFLPIPALAADPSLIISEFRLRGPGGSADEFVEIYNNNDTSVTVVSFDGSAGYSLAASDGVIRFIIPNGTVIPGHGHFLGVNTGGYSLNAYPAGNGTGATGDAGFTTNIADNAGLALFRTSNPANFIVANRLDAVGSTSESNPFFKEGAGYPTLTPFSIDYSLVRKISTFGAEAGLPQDTDNNANDFLFVDTNGTSAGAGQRLGAAGPENLSGPRNNGSNINHAPLDPVQADSDSPNAGHSFVSDPVNNSTFGTLSIRRTYRNNTGSALTRLRFRLIDLSTFPAPSGQVDLRPRSSVPVNVTLTDSSVVTVQGTTLERPPFQPSGGGFYSTMSANAVSAATPLNAGESINLQFLLGLQGTGCYRFAIVPEALPVGGGDVFLISGNSQGSPGLCPTLTPTSSLVISEFRLRGPGGSNDEFVEIYNVSGTDVTVATSDGSSGFALAASDGIIRFTIPNGTVIPAQGHYLGVNSAGYSLGAYPSGNHTTATGDATYTANIADNAGIALFSTANPARFNLGNRLDAVGSWSEFNTIYKEGAGYPSLTPLDLEYSFYRAVPKAGAGAGLPTDSNNNAADFLFVDTNGITAGAGARLGAPGPENLTSSGHQTSGAALIVSLVDSGRAANQTPNYVRNFTPDPADNSTFGTVTFRRQFTNNSGLSITRLRFRIIDLTTFPAPSGFADLRPRNSGSTTVSLSAGGIGTIAGTTLQVPPSQPNGGGFNSSMLGAGINLASPLAAGGSVNLQFRLGVQQNGLMNFCTVIDTLPFTGTAVTCFTGDSTAPVISSSLATSILLPHNNNLFNVGLSVSTDEPADITVRVFGDEDDETPSAPGEVFSPDAKNIAPDTLRLRRERVDGGEGRVYLIVIKATDATGNTSRACQTAVVPKNQNQNNIDSVQVRAAAARIFCQSHNGQAPQGYFVIGGGPNLP